MKAILNCDKSEKYSFYEVIYLTQYSRPSKR